ncbi:MAG: hypothetical protein KAU28_05760, partial [Phycisphaerae bacterium]|nr:hypothetical protein [Phycisphaerae bacterium]
LLWQRQRWHITRKGRFGLPRIVVESKLVSRLPHLREDFPTMLAGICNSQLAAKTFAEAGMRVIAVGSPAVKAPDVTHRKSWSELAAVGS